MKFLKKILIIPIILISITFNTLLADDKNDCQKFAILTYYPDWFSTINDSRQKEWERLSKIIDKNSLNTAILNLKKYCCQKELWGLKQNSETCKIDQQYFNPNALDSPFLFDHLFDVTMRRLNWLTWEKDIYIKTDMREGDSKWMERRQRINKKAESSSWTNPQEIINEYKKFRSQTNKYDINNNVHNVFLTRDRDTFRLYIKWGGTWQESKNIADALNNYENRTLYDRYNNACALTEIFYAFLSNVYSKDMNEIRKLNNECHKIVASQISSEAEYTSLVIKRSSNLFLSNYINGYISYLEKRTNNLKSIRKNSSDKFLDVVRSVSMLTDTCTKW